MQSQIKLSNAVQELLRCPICKARLDKIDGQLVCADPECRTPFPIIDGIPVLLNESSSVFSIKALRRQSRIMNVLLQQSKPNKTRKLSRLTPSIGRNMKAKQNYDRFAELLLSQSIAPRVLVIGGRIAGQGMESLLRYPSIELVQSDVSFGPRAMLICDAHDIPFADGSFDGAIAQAVLEHVADPYRCVDELHRVLRKRGLVYAETAFMQQVHGGRYDFTRFTHLGHRRLFRRFEEIDSGAVCGPGMALAWSYKYFLLSFTRSRSLRAFISAFVSLTSFFLKYFDYYLIGEPGALDAASAYYFLGQRSSHVLSDKELTKLYKGAQLG